MALWLKGGKKGGVSAGVLLLLVLVGCLVGGNNDKPASQPSSETVQKSSELQRGPASASETGKNAETPEENPADKPAETPEENPAEPVADKPAETPEEMPTENPAAPVEETPVTHTVIGNRNSKKYHEPSCASVTDMKEKNKATFDSVEAAKAAGYEPCDRCH